MLLHISPALAKSVSKHKNITKSKITSNKRTSSSSLQTPSRSESQIDAVLRRAIAQIGTPYAYGSTGDGSFDCSGFTAYSYKAANIELPHSSLGQASLGTHVDRDKLCKGDLLIFNNPANTRIGHVGIYIGENNFIHASTSRGVTITSLDDSYYAKRYVGARRILP